MEIPFSPVELTAQYLKQMVPAELIPDANIKPGTLDIEQQRSGGISVIEAGLAEAHPTLPLYSQRMMLTCSGSTYELADRIANYIKQNIDKTGRETVVQPSNSHSYLMHTFDVTAGTTTHVRDQQTWNSTLLVRVLIGTEPIS